MLEAKRQQVYDILKTSTNNNIERLSEEQLDFILHDIESNCFLKACPGSGKTEVITIKAAYEFAQWNKSHSGFLILSFTNKAADEISNRIQHHLECYSNMYPHYVGTIDSWIYRYIFIPFVAKRYINDISTKISVIESAIKADFLNAFQCRTGYAISPTNTIPIFANNIYYDIDLDGYVFVKDKVKTPLVEYLASDAFSKYRRDKEWLTDEKVEEDFVNIKKKFYKSGFFTFQDIEYLSLKQLMSNGELVERISKRFPYIVIDECQDLSSNQILLFDLLIQKGSKIIFVGDVNQSIYEFRNANPDRFMRYVEEQNINKIELHTNYRSVNPIVCLFNKIFPDFTITSASVSSISPNVILWEYNDEELIELPKRFVDYIAMLESKEIDIKRSSVLVRSNSLKNKIQNTVVVETNLYCILAKSLFLYNSDNNKRESIRYFGKFVNKVIYGGKRSTNTFYCPSGYSNIEWRKLLYRLIYEANNALFPFVNKRGNNITWRNWAQKVREHIEGYKAKFTDCICDIDKAKNERLPSNYAKDEIAQILNNSTTHKIGITTIHDVKGMTYDSVLLISDKDKHSKGGHFEQWFFGSNQEYKRLGYVAMSRPRKLLVIAVKTLDDSQKSRLSSLGLICEGECRQLNLFDEF